MAKPAYKKFPIGTLVTVTIPTLLTQPPRQELGLVVPMDEEALMLEKNFVTIHFAVPVDGYHIRVVPVGTVTSVSRPYEKEKRWKDL